MPGSRAALAEVFRAAAEVSPGTLAADLENLDREMRARAPAADWSLYYADWFLTRHSA